MKKHGVGGAARLTPYRSFREHIADVYLIYVICFDVLAQDERRVRCALSLG